MFCLANQVIIVLILTKATLVFLLLTFLLMILLLIYNSYWLLLSIGCFDHALQIAMLLLAPLRLALLFRRWTYPFEWIARETLDFKVFLLLPFIVYWSHYSETSMHRVWIEWRSLNGRLTNLGMGKGSLLEIRTGRMLRDALIIYRSPSLRT